VGAYSHSAAAVALTLSPSTCAATLIRGSHISCGSSSGFALTAVQSGKADLTDSYCRAQRYSPFILQLLFNLMFYILCKMHEAIDTQYGALSWASKLLIDAALVSYCFLLPLVFLGIATAVEGMPDSIDLALPMMIRQTAACVMRFTNYSVEVMLIYLPFITTGIMLTVMSFVVKSSIVKVTMGLVARKRSTNGHGMSEGEYALRVLVVNLVLLGLASFCVLIVFMVTTAVFLQQVHTYAPAWLKYYSCVDTAFACNLDSCDALAAVPASTKPTVQLQGAQLASLCLITVLFGLFFGVLSVSRLAREYRTGKLRIKWRRAVWGVASSVHAASPGHRAHVGQPSEQNSMLRFSSGGGHNEPPMNTQVIET